MTHPSRARSGRSGVAWRRNARRRLRGGGGAPDLLLASSPRCLRAPGERRLGPRGCMGSDGTRILGRRPRIALLRCFCAGAAPALLVVLTDVPERACFVRLRRTNEVVPYVCVHDTTRLQTYSTPSYVGIRNSCAERSCTYMYREFLLVLYKPLQDTRARGMAYYAHVDNEI